MDRFVGSTKFSDRPRGYIFFSALSTGWRSLSLLLAYKIFYLAQGGSDIRCRPSDKLIRTLAERRPKFERRRAIVVTAGQPKAQLIGAFAKCSTSESCYSVFIK